MTTRSMVCALQTGRLMFCLALFGFSTASLALVPGKPQSSATGSSSPKKSSTDAVVAAPVGQTLGDRVNAVFRLRSSRIINMAVADIPDVPITTALDIDGQVFTLNLVPHSIRTANYQLRAQLADGSIVNVDPGPDRMLRGMLAEMPGSQVAGGLLEDGLHIAIRQPNGDRIWVEPLMGRVAGALPDQYVMYRDDQVIHPDGVCGVTNDFLAAHPPVQVPAPNGADEGGIAGSTIYCTELACDADVEYYLAYGSSVTNVQNRINLVINTMDLQYINQVDIDHVITNILVRTAEPDPYSSTNSSTLLGQVQTEWNNNQAAIPRDIVQLFTAKNVDGSVIGISYLSSICTLSQAYSLVQSDCCGGLACATDLSAHELGHSWSATHCTCPSSTMNPSITCVNTFANSSPDTAAQIISFRNSRPCLSQCADATLPFVDNFPSTTIDPAKWTTIVGVTSNTLGTNEPSTPNSLDLKGSANGGTQIRTSRINATNLSDFQMSYKYEARGGGDLPETGDNLVVEYFNNLGVWTQIALHTPAGASQTSYTINTVLFPADALHSEFRMRFRNTSTQANLDDWFVDDVNISGFVPPANDNCASATLVTAGTHPFTTQGSTTDGPDEPTGCGFAAPTQITRDVWFKWLATCTGQATVSLCGSSFDARLAAYFGCPSGSGASLGCNDNFCGTSPQITFSVTQNQLIRIRIGGASNAVGTGSMVISCVAAPPPCPSDVNNSGSVDIDDLVVVITNWGATGGIADINHDNQVNIDDLVAVITAWGVCP